MVRRLPTRYLARGARGDFVMPNNWGYCNRLGGRMRRRMGMEWPGTAAAWGVLAVPRRRGWSVCDISVTVSQQWVTRPYVVSGRASA